MRDGSGVNNPAPYPTIFHSEGAELVGLVGQDWLTEQIMGVDSAGHSWQAGVRSMHTGGANITMCDGSVHFISNNIDCNSGGIDMNDLALSLHVWDA